MLNETNPVGSKLTHYERSSGFMSIIFCALSDVGSCVKTNTLLNNEIFRL
jgi:hypothetical protein